MLCALQSVQADIICLQECRLPFRSSYRAWEELWRRGPSLWSGSNSSWADGVAVLVNSKSIEVVGSSVICPGRVLSASLLFNGAAFKLLNIYCPPKKNERWELLQELPPHLLGRAPLLMLGDFNTVLNRAGRKGAGENFKVDKTSFYLQKLLTDFKLTDVFSSLNPGEDGFTWHSSDGSQASRIDFLLARGFAGLATNLSPVFYSDHSMLCGTLAVKSGVAVGKGVWKLNCQLLKDSAVVMAFNDFYKELQSLQCFYDTRADWWEEAKKRIKGFFIQRGRERKAKGSREWLGLQKRLNRYEGLLKMGFDFKEERDFIKREMAVFTEEKYRSIMFLSREREIEEGEKCTRYFFKKILGRRVLIKGLKGEDGVLNSSTEGMLRVAEGFYNNLFKEKEVDQGRIGEVLNFLEGEVGMVGGLGRSIQLGELEESVKSFKRGRSPGLDGLPQEFYVTFWHLLAPDILAVFNEFDSLTILPESFREGVVTLLFKKGEASDLRNWRPITLLNFDLKLFSKVLTLRMATVLEDVIHPDQTCAVAGRRITDSLVLVRDAICYARDRDIRLAVLNLDFEKAFDRVSHQYLFEVLRKMGFPAGFVARVGLLYSAIRSRILVNGFVSNAVDVRCGVRQGCPLSPLLFICAIEPLAQVLRRDARITGLGIPGSGGQEVRCALYMDDVTVLCTDAPSLDRTVDRTVWFGEASGARLNADKCDLKLYGRWTPTELRGMPMTAKTDDIRILGVLFNSDGRGEGNWEGILKKTEQKFNYWRMRGLTLEGKILILKTVILPVWLFPSRVFVPSRVVLSRLDRLVFYFLWGTRWERLTRAVMKKRQEKGGKGVVDFYLVLWCHSVALQVSLCLSMSCKASFFVRFFMGAFLRSLGVLKVSLRVPVAFKMVGGYKNVKAFVQRMGLEKVGAGVLTSQKSLVSFVQDRDPVSRVRGLALGRAGEVWNAVAHPDLLHRHKDLAWLAAHEVLSVRGMLHARRLDTAATCPWPSCTEEESVRHCLWDCAVARDAWGQVRELCRALLEPGTVIGAPSVLFGVGRARKTRRWRCLWLVINAMKDAIWTARLAWVKNRQSVSPQSMGRMAKASIRDYMWRDRRRRGVDWARAAWGHAAWTLMLGPGGPA